MDPVRIAFLTHSALLLVTALLLVYPLVAYAQNVAYTEGFVLLALGFLTFTVSYVLGTFQVGTDAMRSGLSFFAAVFATVGIWSFAREFVSIESNTFEVAEKSAEGGFERAEDE